MREVGSSKDVKVTGTEYHNYYLSRVDDSKKKPDEVFEGEFGHVNFQEGPIGEVGVNGCQNEDLLHIVIDRLKYFQNGFYACRENDLALTKVQEALHWLNARTLDRVARGVEGKNVL